MRDTIDFGIDLGTTNSAIAVCDDGVVTVIKNSDNRDITPSAVWKPGRDQVFVGDKARQYVEQYPEDAVAEFKQIMGVAGAEVHFEKADIRMTPQQLSAEHIGLAISRQLVTLMGGSCAAGSIAYRTTRRT